MLEDQITIVREATSQERHRRGRRLLEAVRREARDAVDCSRVATATKHGLPGKDARRALEAR